jgi:hypothetical protein
MTGQRIQPPVNGFGALQRFARRPAANERCEVCGLAVAPQHEHLLEVEHRRLVCACQACAILFSGQIGQRYKRVPSRVQVLPQFQLTDAQWENLTVPINMAFLVEQSTTGKMIAMYPSPAGATESQLPLDTWQQLTADNPGLRSMEPDVEALLVNRLGEKYGFHQHQYFLLPIDQCFRLVGLVRTHWRGLSGGAELWQELAGYFAGLSGNSAEGRHA